MRLTKLTSWQALSTHRHAANFNLGTLFANDANRFENLSFQCEGLLADCSKNLLNDDTLQRLIALANDRDLAGRIAQLFSGDNANFTEHRPAWHMATRAPAPLSAASNDLHHEIAAEYERLRVFVDAIHGGRITGHAGKRIRHVVHIGIGGPHLGPAFACKALSPCAQTGLSIHFLSTVDGTALRRLLGTIDPGATLAVVASKTFSTEETLANAREVWQWLAQSLGHECNPANHFAATTGAPDAAAAFGIRTDRTFHVWPWVGGRFSLCSSMGLPVALAAGMAAFEQLRQGAAAMDRHFFDTPFERNIPVILGLIDVWYANFFDADTRVVLPYVDRFDGLPCYLQQVEMESLGKRISRHGKAVDYATGMMTWGSAGTNGQHAFMQLLSQGTGFAPVDIIATCRAPHGLPEFHQRMLANALAQAEARMTGQNESAVRERLKAQGLAPQEVDRLAPHLVLPGNLPTTLILLPEADAYHIGMLAALYEHKVFVESVIWDINAFDQWGVEFAKGLSSRITGGLACGDYAASGASSTHQLIRYIRAQQLPHRQRQVGGY